MSKSKHVFMGFLLALGLPSGAGAADDAPLAEVLVTASLRRVPLLQLPNSVTVLDATRLARSSIEHLQDVLPLVPNLNWASGTSRPRYFQLRGVGETEQWQGAPNSSVGFLIDDIDFSGVGMPAGSFDLGQIEVLRGPQGTSYGANALAGLIALRGREPTAALESAWELTAGDYGTRAVAGLISGPLGSPDLLGRLSVQRHRSDGFRRNLTLQRKDTNSYDETFARSKIHYRAGERTWFDLSGLWADLDNGYDAFALDNSRNSRADKPGRDAQRSLGASALLVHEFRNGSSLRSVSALADSSIVYSFDGDWTAAADNDFTSDIDRVHRVVSQDLRWLSATSGRCAPCWLLGLYGQSLRESLAQLDLYNGAIYRELTSDYRAGNVAAYGQLEFDWSPATRLALGLRREQRSARYQDSDATRLQPRDRMIGGQVSLAHTWGGGSASAAWRWYASLARGYKAGGFNIGAAVPAVQRGYGPEFLWSAETGLSAADGAGRWQARLALFAMRRREQQVATSLQLDPADPLSFLYLTTNRGHGRNDGLEAEGHWQLTERLSLAGSLGLLRARRADGRDQEHAPRAQFSLSVDWRQPQGWFAHADAQHVARFYFSDSHDQVSTPYTLVNLKLGIERGAWSGTLWLKNVLHERYAQRGFYFGNEPPDFPERLYLQQSDPRQVGLSLSYRLSQLP